MCSSPSSVAKQDLLPPKHVNIGESCDISAMRGAQFAHALACRRIEFRDSIEVAVSFRGWAKDRYKLDGKLLELFRTEEISCLGYSIAANGR